MADHDFRTLYQQYPALIAQMPEIFTSHEFTLRLAQEHQSLYVEALYSYRNTTNRGQPAPFMLVHGILSRRLSKYPEFVRRVGRVRSADIFGRAGECAQWRKV